MGGCRPARPSACRTGAAWTCAHGTAAGPTPTAAPAKPEAAARQPSSAPKKAAAAPVKAKPSGGGGRGALLDAIKAGKKLSNSRKERNESAKAKQQAARKRPMSLMDHLKDRLKARNNLMSGKTDPAAAKSRIAGFVKLPNLDQGAPARFADDMDVNVSPAD